MSPHGGVQTTYDNFKEKLFNTEKGQLRKFDAYRKKMNAPNAKITVFVNEDVKKILEQDIANRLNIGEYWCSNIFVDIIP